jgi:predicted 3-demethylubiquinone-9 3-methyltransferase (glyoxalase superfamily)
MPSITRITPCLWFDRQAEEAVALYASVFPDSRILQVARYGEAGHELHGMPAGSVMTISFELAGHGFIALNGGPHFRFNEAISFEILCQTQAEIDHYWTRLTEGGDVQAQQCGWLKDRFGVSWQVTPAGMYEMLNHADRARADRAMVAMLQMKKIDLAALEHAFAG